MATELATAYVALVPSLQGAQGAIAKEFGAAGDSGGKALGAGLLGTVAKFAGPIAAAVGIGKAISVGFDEVKDAAAVTAQLAAGIKSTGGAAGTTVAEMNKLASSIQGYSGQTDDSIGKAQSLLLTFTNIKNNGIDNVFDDATRAAADMAARFGGDASSNAVLLGKALNDPTKGLTALTRVGVAFTDQQKEQIKTLQASGDTLGAQKIILAELNNEFGGSAKAFGDTLPGQIERAKRGFEDITQSLVGGLVPAIMPVLDLLLRGMAAAAPVIESVGQAIGENLTGVFEKLAPVFDQVFEQLGPIFEAIGGAAGDAFGSIADAILPLLPSLLTLVTTLSPVGLLFDAIAPLLPQLAEAFATLAGAVGGALSSALTTLLPVFIELAGIVSGVLSDALAQLLPIIIDVIALMGPVLATIIQALVPIITVLAEIFGTLVQAVAPLIAPLLGLIEPIAELVAALLPPLVELFAALLMPILDLISPLLDLLAPALEFIITVLSALITGVVTVITWFVKLISGSSEASDQLAGIWKGVLDFFAGIWRGIVGFFSDGIKKAVSFVTELPGKVLAALGNLGSLLFNAGRDLIQGLIDGAGSLLKNIGKFFLKLLPSWIVEPFKAAMGIHSPSTVMAGLGLELPRGVAQGINAGRGLVEASMAALMGPISTPVVRIDATVTGPGFDGASRGAPDEPLDLSDQTIDKLARTLAQAVTQLARITDRMGVA